MRRVERDAADRDFELFLDLRLGLDGAVPVRGCEAAVDLGLVRILRGEECDEVFLRLDLHGVRVAEFCRAVEE